VCCGRREIAWFLSSRRLTVAIKQIGLEAGPLSQLLHAGLKRAGFETVLLETRHVKAALSAMTVKTDRKDARRLAQLIRCGWLRPVHAKSRGSQEVRTLPVARKCLHGLASHFAVGYRVTANQSSRLPAVAHD
jgi:transposase